MIVVLIFSTLNIFCEKKKKHFVIKATTTKFVPVFFSYGKGLDFTWISLSYDFYVLLSFHSYDSGIYALHLSEWWCPISTRHCQSSFSKSLPGSFGHVISFSSLQNAVPFAWQWRLLTHVLQGALLSLFICRRLQQNMWRQIKSVPQPCVTEEGRHVMDDAALVSLNKHHRHQPIHLNLGPSIFEVLMLEISPIWIFLKHENTIILKDVACFTDFSSFMVNLCKNDITKSWRANGLA